jgi:hypothetical protein
VSETKTTSTVQYYRTMSPRPGSDDLELELECDQQMQQLQQQHLPQHQNMNKNPEYGYWASAPPSPLQARREISYDSCVSDESPTTEASTRSSGTSSSHSAMPAANVAENEDEREHYRRQYQYQNQIQYYPEEVDGADNSDNDDDDNVVLWDRPSWTLSSILPWQWCIPGGADSRSPADGGANGNVTPSNSITDLNQMNSHPSHQQQLHQLQLQQQMQHRQQQQMQQHQQHQQQQHQQQHQQYYFQQQQQQQYALYPSYPHPAAAQFQHQQHQLQQHHMFVQQQQQQQLHGGLGREEILAHDHGDDASWSSRSGSSISLSGSESISIGSSFSSSSDSEPSMAEDRGEWNASTPTRILNLPPVPAWQQQWTTPSKNQHQHQPQASWNSGTTSSTPPPPPPPLLSNPSLVNNNEDNGILSQPIQNPSSPILTKPRLARRSNTTCGGATSSSSCNHGSQLSMSMHVPASPKTPTTMTTTTTTTSSPASSLGRPPLLARRGVSAPGALRMSTITTCNSGTGSSSPQQQAPLTPSPAPPPSPLQHQRSPLQHHHPNLNYSNHSNSNHSNSNHSNSKPPRSTSKTGNNVTTPDVAVVSPMANTQSSNTPTRPRLGSRDLSTGSLHRRQSGGSFEFHTNGPSPIVTALARNISSGSNTPDFPTTIEYRAATLYDNDPSPLPVMSPSLVRGTSWSSNWTEEPEVNHKNDDNHDMDDLWISEDEEYEHGAVVSDSESHVHQTAGEIERKRSLGYISPAEGDSSSSSASLSSSSEEDGQEKDKQEPQQPEHQLQQVAPPNDWMLQWAQQGTTTAATPFTTVESPAMIIDDDIPTQEEDITVDTGPVYLPAPNKDESTANSKVILSAWVAISADESLLIKLAASDGRPTLVRSDLALLELTCDSLILRRGANQDVTVVPLSNDCQVGAREISSRAGKCVVISKSSNTVCTILPVSLPQQFFAATGYELVETDRFDRLQSCMFTPFVVETPTPLSKSKPAAASRTATCDLMWGQEYCVRHYAPNEQHDMARHLQFAIDSAIRMS